MKKILFFISIFTITGFLIGFNTLAQETETRDSAIEETEEADTGELIISPGPGERGLLESEDVDEEEPEEVAADEDITAEDLGVSEPKMLPDSPWYFAKSFWRGVRAAFTFNKVKKAELRLSFANEMLIEAKKLAEETGKEEVFQKTLEKYQKEIEKLGAQVEKFKEKAGDNPKIDKFLDKYTDKAIKHQRLMDRLEKNLSDKPEVLEKIRTNKERALERFGEVMNRLEEKNKIQERLENNLEKIEGSKYKNFKNLEVLLQLEEKVPEQAKDAIRRAQENALKKLHGNLENMSSEDQEKFGKYLEGVSGDQTTHLEIMERLNKREFLPVLKETIEQNRERVQERVQIIKENVEQLKEQIQEKTQEQIQEQTQEQTRERVQEQFCITVWDPVCGKDGKTYSNACFAKAAGVEIVHKGKCIQVPEKSPSIIPQRSVSETCNNLCGDGVCQEVVCLAIGCPCAETPETCPQDCGSESNLPSGVKKFLGQ